MEKILYLFAILFAGYSSLAQTVKTDKSFTLPPVEGGHVEYKARENIKLTTGFSFSADDNNTFKGHISDFVVASITYDDNTERTAPDYNLPVGTIPGQAGVSPTGGATYNIPIVSSNLQSSIFGN